VAIRIEHEFRVPASTLWEIVGTPDRVDWVPGVTECIFDGEVRRLIMPGAGQIAERILAHDDEQMSIEYSCFESKPALKHHLASIRLKAKDSQSCLMIWETEVEPQEVEPFIKQSMQGCLVRIQELIEQPPQT
jgi:hypothetical protein